MLSVYISDKRRTIWLIASYIRKYVEGEDLGLQWENRLYVLRERCRRRKLPSPGQNIVLIEFLLFNFLGLTECVLFFLFAYAREPTPAGQLAPSPPLWFLAIPLGLYAVLLAQTTRQYRTLSREGLKSGTIASLWPVPHEETQKVRATSKDD